MSNQGKQKAMVEKVIKIPCDIVDFARYQSGRNAAGKLMVAPQRACRHCGAALLDDESEDECSSAFNPSAAGRHAEQRKFYAE
jgi:hypothetical protein